MTENRERAHKIMDITSEEYQKAWQDGWFACEKALSDVRREALEEAAQASEAYDRALDDEWLVGYRRGRREAAVAIRKLIF